MKYIDVFVVLFLGFASLMDIKFKKVSNLYLLFWLVVGMCIKKYIYVLLFEIFWSGRYKINGYIMWLPWLRRELVYYIYSFYFSCFI